MGSKAPSWSDQWGNGGLGSDEYEDDVMVKKNNKSNGSGKMEDAKAMASVSMGKAKTVAIVGADKAKSAAVVGAQKVKSGTSAGFKWIKNQCQKKKKSQQLRLQMKVLMLQGIQLVHLWRYHTFAMIMSVLRPLEVMFLCLYGGLRIGLYEPVKNLYVGKDHVGDAPLVKKILAALTTGAAVAIAVANPTDLVKVRLQAEGKFPPGVPRCYTGSLNAYSTIVKQEGVRTLWTGIGPNVARNAIINAAELASYDQVKETILKIPGFTDNVVTHLLWAGFFAVCIGSPVDVVKSRMTGDPSYKSTIGCFVKTLKNDVPHLCYDHVSLEALRGICHRLSFIRYNILPSYILTKWGSRT
ncbi:mitochondrial uncoupling protein 1 isoform X6 [Lathyrus oleraceus]|nr:mitochondrial uncoupling protein 1-like isoform X6 [Pisum sativum]